MQAPAKKHDVIALLAEREFLVRALIESAERERRRIGQQLHDDLCQLLLGAAFCAKAVAQSLPAASPAAAELDDLMRLINSAARQSRDLALELNITHLDAHRFSAALEHLAAGRAGGIPCRLEYHLVSEAPSAGHLYRIAQEAVANAAQHSGGTEIVVRVEEDEESVHLQIADDGCGFNERTCAGLGVAMMKYRAETINGRLRFDTPQRGGTRVTCSLPRSP